MSVIRMGILDFLRGKAVQPAIQTNLGEPPKGTLPLSMMSTFGSQGTSKEQAGRLVSNLDINLTARQRYVIRKRHPFTAAVHNAIVKQVKKVEIIVDKIDDEGEINKQTKERMEQFLLNGWGEGGEKELRARMVDTKKWYGDSFSEIVVNPASSEPLLVNYLLSETMRVLPDEHGRIIGYPQVVDGKLNYTFPTENILHLVEHQDEYNFFFGFSDLDSLYFAILLDILADEANMARLTNDALPSGILTFNDMDEIELARVRWETITFLQKNPGKLLFFNRVPQWIPAGVGDRKDIDYVELHRAVKEKIMMVYGVLPMQVAIVDSGKLANPEQQLEIGEEYIRQELETIQNAYNRKLTPLFKDSQNLMFRFKELDPKLDALKKQADILNANSQAARNMAAIPGAFTVDEVRGVCDFDPLENDMGQVPVQQPIQPTFGQPQTDQQPPQDNVGKSAVANDKAAPPTDVQGKPFAGFADMADCMEQNGDKEDPAAYCATIMRETENAPAQEAKMLTIHKSTRAQNRELFLNALEKPYAKFSKAAIRLAKEYYPTPAPTKDASVRTKTISIFEVALGGLINALHLELDATTAKHSKKTYKDAKEALGVSFGEPDARAIERLLDSGGVLNAVKDFSKSQQAGFTQVMKDAFENGLDERKMAKAMRNYADVETYRLTRIARTETNRFANQGRFAGYDEMETRRGEKFEFDWVGPSDERTSELCFDIKASNPYSLEELMNVTDGGEPHPNCRHSVVRHFD